MLRKYISILIFLLALYDVAAQPLGFSLPPGKSKVTIPIEVHNNLVVVPLVLNGSLPLKFILDTGVRTAILTQKTFSDILNLPYAKRYFISGPGGEKIVEAYITHNVSLDLPGVSGRGHALLVLGEDYLELRNYLGTDVHGILGYELFSRFVVMIDYEKKLLTLMHPKRFSPRRKFQVIPLSIEDTKPYLVAPVVLQDGTRIDAKLLVDSGASHGIMLEQTSDPRIKVSDSTVSSIIGRGLGGEITGKAGRIESLELGSLLLKKPIANFPDPNSYVDTLKMGTVFRNGAIGGEVLGRFTTVFDFPREKLYLRKNSGFKRPFYYNLSGVTIKARGAQLNVFEIIDVREKSAASVAGIKAGDVVVSINGHPAKSLELNHIIGLFNSKPGKKVNLVVDRKGERLRKEFVLKDQI